MRLTEAMIEKGIAVDWIERRSSGRMRSPAARATIAAIKTTFVE